MTTVHASADDSNPLFRGPGPIYVIGRNFDDRMLSIIIDWRSDLVNYGTPDDSRQIVLS